jgi:hypothetical protein
MKTVYLAIECTVHESHGPSEVVLGVFSTPDKAKAALEKRLWFDQAEHYTAWYDKDGAVGSGEQWTYVFDGTMQIHFFIEVVTIDKPIGKFT